MKYALVLLYVSEIIISRQSTKENENTICSQTKIIVNHDQYMDISLGQRLYLGTVCVFVCTCACARIVVVLLGMTPDLVSAISAHMPL